MRDCPNIASSFASSFWSLTGFLPRVRALGISSPKISHLIYAPSGRSPAASSKVLRSSSVKRRRSAQVFVAVLGASSYTYAEATWSQSLPDWIGSHVRAFTFYGGLPEIVVPDNLKSAVSKACRYDPELNSTYQQMAEYYGVAVIPARPYKPKDKAKAEVGVQIVERWIMMRLRKLTFYTLASINIAIRSLLDELNQRPFINGSS